MKKTWVSFLFFVLVVLSTGCASVERGVFDFVVRLERSRAGLALKNVRVGDGSFFYLERRGDGDVIVLLHGFSANKDNWVRFVEYLPAEYRILVFDMPGHGDNERDINRTWSASALSEGVARVAEKLGLRRFHIVGGSLGGLVAKLYALDHPEKVKSIGLFDSAGVESPTRGEFQVMLENEDNLFEVGSREDFDRLEKFVFHKPPFLPWPVRSVMSREYIRRNPFYLKMLNGIIDRESAAAAPITEKLKHLKMPALVVWGDRDRILHVSSVEVYKRRLPDVRVVIMKDCGHVPMIERPEESAGYYARFLEEIAGRP